MSLRPARLNDGARVAALLFVSGLCALAYQTAWLRQLRLVFGASTAASAAVLAIFMAGLGLGSVVLGRRADRAANPLALYARLEIAIALLAAASPALIAGARWLYIALGGTATLGPALGTLARLALSAAVIGPPTFLMGGTLPAALRAAASSEDRGRRVLGLLYGANTLGAVSGALLVTFVTVEQLGIRASILVAAALNLGLGLLALAASRSVASAEEDGAVSSPGEETERSPTRFVLAAAATVGFVFLLMELVWYRMLSPILGGSSYTFGLILAVALAGIGAGGLLYGVGGRSRRPTLHGFASTCALEALALALPFALGDRLAFAALVLRGLAGGGFTALIAGWSVIAAVVVLPAAIVAGYQFPLLVGVLGSGTRAAGRQVGVAYGWNTAGAIAGSLAGGFGVLPLLTAPVAWRWAAIVLVALALGASWLARLRREPGRLALPVMLSCAALVAAATVGPTAAWRHGRIGAGRFAGAWDSPNALRASFQSARSAIVWEAEGVESSVALWDDDGYAFFINGKSDGNARGDAATQVMGGLVGAMLHPEPRAALVIGLGTGSTAGWLAQVPGMERVDVAEIEPAVRRVAEDCEPVNQACLRNPRVALHWGDARELLLTTRERYDIIFSEPSNPYRAGISSLFTLELYRAAARRLRPRGVYLQWVQGYEVDAEVVRTAFATLNEVFPFVEAWQLHSTDLLLVGSMEALDHDIARERARAAAEPYASALNHVWGVSGVEGFYAGFLAPPELARELSAAAGGDFNTDDRPRIEFGFIRSLGRSGLFEIDDVRRAAGGRRPPAGKSALDWERVEDMRRARSLLLLESPAPASAAPDSPAGLRARARIAFASGRLSEAAGLWMRQPDLPVSRADLLLLASGLAEQGADPAPTVFAALEPLAPTETRALEARWRFRRGDPRGAADVLEEALQRYRIDPWPHPPTMSGALELAIQLSGVDSALAHRMFAALREPFSLHLLNRRRLTLRVGVAELLGNSDLCREALAPFESKPQWDRLLLQARVRCYGGGSGSTARRAARDLASYLAAEPRTLF